MRSTPETFLFGNNRIATATSGRSKYGHSFGGPHDRKGASRKDCNGILIHLLHRVDRAHSHSADANVPVFSNHAVDPVVCSTLDLMSRGVKRQLLRPSRVRNCRKACSRSSQRFVSMRARICSIASALSFSQ
jgi:hypothetical protein